MTTKLIKAVTYNEEFPSIRSHDPLITWSVDFYFSYTIYIQYNFLQFVGLECKRLSRHQLLVWLMMVDEREKRVPKKYFIFFKKSTIFQ